MPKTLHLALLISSLALLLIPALTLAEEAVVNCATTDFVADLSGDDWKQYIDTGSGKEGPATRSACSANCKYGSAFTNSCSGTCTAVDQNCSAGPRGYVSCNGTIVDLCDPCPPPCSAQTTCPDGTVIGCTAFNGGTSCSSEPSCFVDCGPGNYKVCPGAFFCS